MRIRLVAPAVSHDDYETRTDAFPIPRLALQVLATLTPPGHEVVIVDEAFGPSGDESVPDLVGITATTHQALRAYEIADEWRQRGAAVVLGGIHPTILPNEALLHADAVVEGEAEELWSGVVADAAAGVLHRRYRAETLPDRFGFAAPSRHLYPRPRRWLPRVQGLEASRGCPFACEFCAISGGSRRYRTRPVGDVVQEASSTSGAVLFFTDDALCLDRRHAREFLGGIEALGKTWIGQGTLSLAEEPGLLRLMRLSGCRGLLVGIESPDARRANLPKLTRLAIGTEDAVRRFHDAGIGVVGSFVFGLDHQGPDVFDRALELAERARLDGTNPCLLHPYPGTPLYNRLADEGRLLEPRWWLHRFTETRVPFRPLGMSIDQLFEGWVRFGRRFHSLSSFLSRLSGASPWRRGALGLTAVVLYNAAGRHYFKHMQRDTASRPRDRS
jgi:radical SAM superfamily enzyme YgiQ (UPF0313 family)